MITYSRLLKNNNILHFSFTLSDRKYQFALIQTNKSRNMEKDKIHLTE